MKPRIRPHPLYRGMWLCGGLWHLDECLADSPAEAYAVWRWDLVRKGVL